MKATMAAIFGDLAMNRTGLFLIVFGSAILGVGCHANWSEMKQAGIGIIGAGTLAVQTQIKNTLVNKPGATANVGSDGPLGQ